VRVHDIRSGGDLAAEALQVVRAVIAHPLRASARRARALRTRVHGWPLVRRQDSVADGLADVLRAKTTIRLAAE
jgi:hypothetical protein